VKVLVTGASGLIGSALLPALRADGHEVMTLVRREPAGPDEVRWDPAAGRLDAARLAGCDAAVHLAGAPVGKRWTRSYKNSIMDSRVLSTSLLARALAGLDPRPRVLLSASGIDFYGDTGERPVTEESPSGEGFLAEVCRRWEAAADPAREVGIRTVTMRSGIVLSRAGGALRRQLPIFRLGLGGRLGSGRQYTSWISLRDEVAAMRFLLTADEVAGPVNLTSPQPVTNREFTAQLARAVHRPAVLPVPGAALRAALGQFATEAVLGGHRVLPARLQSAGYVFADPTLSAALAGALQ
jgi:uncharacterized protein (TIGR01777 family)